jgi:hypothetical protein
MTRSEADWVVPDRDRIIGTWSARAMFVLDFDYVVVFIVGFASLGNVSDPLPDPYLAIAAILILLIALMPERLRVVVLNGASSAGKTTLATAFRDQRAAVGDFWLLTGIDERPTDPRSDRVGVLR